MTNMIEKVARAYAAAWKKDIKAFIGIDVPSWDELVVEQHAAMMRCSAAAIEAMRDATMGMSNAGSYVHVNEGGLADEIYTAMIDAALKE